MLKCLTNFIKSFIILLSLLTLKFFYFYYTKCSLLTFQALSKLNKLVFWYVSKLKQKWLAKPSLSNTNF